MGKRNFNEFIDVFDKVFVLDVDVDTLNERLDNVLMMTGARARASGNSSCVYTPQKKTYRAVASKSMQHSRLSASWTKSLAMSEY